MACHLLSLRLLDAWNAAKRVLTMGYRNVARYPKGPDGWEASGLPLETPAPGGGE
jgi:hypothetical protein